MIFLIVLWATMFIAIGVLLVLIVTTLIHGAPRLDLRLFTEYPASSPARAGARPAILGSIWVIATTAVLAIPLGIAAAVQLEEFADKTKRVNQLIELNVQNLAAIPSVVYGLLALALLTLLGVQNKNLVIAGATALSLLILPVIIIATREALRSVPAEIREGSLALGATPMQTMWRQTLPSAIPGIATGAILALSRALGEAARCCCWVRWCSSATTRTGCCRATPPCPSRSSTGPADRRRSSGSSPPPPASCCWPCCWP